jgi:hypothetical protein
VNFGMGVGQTSAQFLLLFPLHHRVSHAFNAMTLSKISMAMIDVMLR